MSVMYKLLAVLVLLGLAFGAGMYIGRGTQQVITQDRIVYKEGETKVVDHIVTVTRTVQKDGTVTETTKTEDKDTDKKTAEKEKDHSSVVTPMLSQYKLGIRLHELRSTGDLTDYTKVELDVSRRVLGPLWLDGGIGIDKSITLGVSYEF